MERLTEETQLGPFASLKDKAEAKPGAFHDYDCLYAHMTAVTSLKAYEDTGLEPEEITALSELKTSLSEAEQKMLNDYLGLGSIDRLRELAEADKDGQCSAGCEYCRERKPILDDIGQLQIDDSDSTLWYIAQVAADDIYEDHTEIRYCPMCGRKLAQEAAEAALKAGEPR